VVSRYPFVFVDQAMQNWSTLDALFAEVCHWVGRSRWTKVTGTVRTSTVVVANIPFKHNPQMPLTEDQHEVGEFGSDGAHEPFGETVRLRLSGQSKIGSAFGPG
jgi:hypothetical protein